MEDLLHFYHFKNETIHSTKINLIDKTKILLELRKIKIQFFDLTNKIDTPRTAAQYAALTKSIDLLHINFDLIPNEIVEKTYLMLLFFGEMEII